MSNKNTLFIAAAALVLLLAAAYILYNQLGSMVETQQLTGQTSSQAETDSSEQTSDASENQDLTMAPDFTVYDIDGNEVKLSDFVGKPVVLNFWASWCGPCKSEMPDFETVYNEYGNDIHFMIVNMTDGSRETLETASSYVKESGYTFPVYYDTEYDAAVTYSVYSLPTTYFIDSKGYLVAQGSGALDIDTLYQGIGMILD
ncbi:MAG: TlpA family protein disulfide reductase [Oscillospiraceae bacterium]|nr:TlpA family protein disulfide reductase [Oscillospiraceae bacterium]